MPPPPPPAPPAVESGLVAFLPLALKVPLVRRRLPRTKSRSAPPPFPPFPPSFPKSFPPPPPPPPPQQIADAATAAIEVNCPDGADPPVPATPFSPENTVVSATPSCPAVVNDAPPPPPPPVWLPPDPPPPPVPPDAVREEISPLPAVPASPFPLIPTAPGPPGPPM